MYGAIGAEYNTTALETDAYGTNVQKIIGLPTSDEVNTSIAAGGRVNHLSNGVIFWSPSTGAHVLYGAIRAEYQATASETDAYGQNVQKLIGLPTSDEANSPIAAGARLNHFSHGTIYWSGATGAHVVFGAIGAEYNHLASETDAYGQNVQKIVGLPTSDEVTVPGVSGARKNSFQHGNIFWSPNTGATSSTGQSGACTTASAGRAATSASRPTTSSAAALSASRTSSTATNTGRRRVALIWSCRSVRQAGAAWIFERNARPAGIPMPAGLCVRSRAWRLHGSVTSGAQAALFRSTAERRKVGTDLGVSNRPNESITQVCLPAACRKKEPDVLPHPEDGRVVPEVAEPSHRRDVRAARAAPAHVRHNRDCGRIRPYRFRD